MRAFRAARRPHGIRRVGSAVLPFVAVGALLLSATAPRSLAQCSSATCRPMVSSGGQRRVARCVGPLHRMGLLRCRRLQVGRCCVATAQSDPFAWKSLFDGKTLGGWKSTAFGLEGEVYVEDGKIIMENGSHMTGITWTGDVPRDNYEIEYEGMRLGGVDFFATLTFPVGDDECSLVTGGWGGTTVGISTVDFYDASDNLTTTFHDFDYDTWYKFRVRVTPAKIEAWIDGQKVVNLERANRTIDYRSECELSRPLGFATYDTAGTVRNIRIRNLEPADAASQP